MVPSVQSPQTYPVLTRCSSVPPGGLMLPEQQQMWAGGLRQRWQVEGKWGELRPPGLGKPCHFCFSALNQVLLRALSRPAWVHLPGGWASCSVLCGSDDADTYAPTLCLSIHHHLYPFSLPSYLLLRMKGPCSFLRPALASTPCHPLKDITPGILPFITVSALDWILHLPTC